MYDKSVFYYAPDSDYVRRLTITRDVARAAESRPEWIFFYADFADFL